MTTLIEQADAAFEVNGALGGNKTILISAVEEDEGEWFLSGQAIDSRGRAYPIDGWQSSEYSSREEAIAAIDGVMARRKYKFARRIK